MIIYKTTNLTNGKFYIGKDKNNDPSYLGSGIILLQAINKYGKSKFQKEILENCQNEIHLNEREKYWIAKLQSSTRGIGYNITEGGSGGNTFTNQSEQRKKEIRLHLVESFHSKVKNSEGYKTRGIKISKTKMGCIFSKKHKLNLSRSHMGQNAWNKGIKMPLLSESKKIKIDQKLIELIKKLYLNLSPKTISDILKELKILTVSVIVIRRILKEEMVYVSDNTRLRKNPNITREQALAIAQTMI